MTRGDLIYDWRKSEGSFRDKLSSFVIVAVVFAIFFGVFQVRYASPRNDRSGHAEILRFRDDELGRFWLLQAEENGPFPGRLEFDGHRASITPGGIGGDAEWNRYRSRLRPMGEAAGDWREELTQKGARVFPARVKAKAAPAAQRELRQSPILIPYDFQTLGWLPDSLPEFRMPGGAAIPPAPWRFTVNLGEDGSVRNAISLGGGDDVGREAVQEWLRGVRFKEAQGDRWLGLRVEFVNLPDDGTEPE